MKIAAILSVLLLCVCALAPSAAAQADSGNFYNSRSDFKEQLISTTRFLEENPLDKDAKALRSRAFVWVAETKDVSIVICMGTGGPLIDKKFKYSSELMIQYTIAMAAFKLENPDKAGDEDAAQLAGVESALRAYASILKKKPKSKWAPIEELVTKQNNGELAKFAADANCGRK